MMRADQVDNFAIYRPKKEYMRLELRVPKSNEVDQLIKDGGLKEMEYDDRWERYRIRRSSGDVQKYREVFMKLLAKAEQLNK
jgi:hypothetical protein